MPAGAIQDKYEYVFIYAKNGVKKDFPVTALPDSTWTFAERKEKLVLEGKNNVPLINDFSLTAEDGTDVTDSILNNPSTYYLFFIKELPENTNAWLKDLKLLVERNSFKRKLYVVTAQKNIVKAFMEKNNILFEGILSCDATAIKTAARANPSIYLMNGPVIQGKWSWADIDKAGE